ncbi:MAG: FitA-like ribbon-helix-helix domain-containing protein [Solirubrobacterales bacterium]
MTKMIQVRNVPEKVHTELKRRARERKQTLTAYVEELLEREVMNPSRQDVVKRIKGRKPVALDRPIAEYVGEERETREVELTRRLERSQTS